MFKLILIICTFFIHNFSFSQEIIFKDSCFKIAILNHVPKIDLNNDGTIQIEEALLVKELNLYDKGITVIDDVKYFPNLVKLVITKNKLTEIKLESLEKLESLSCALNSITRFELSDMPNLKRLACGFNIISSLNLINIPNLESINFPENRLTEIDLSQFEKLKYLDLQDNLLKKLDLSNNIELIQINIEKNFIEELDIRKNIKLNIKIMYRDSKVVFIATPEQEEIIKVTPNGPKVKVFSD